MFRWTAEATEEQKQQVAAGPRRLPALLPVLRAYQVGPDLGLAEGNFDLAVVADFDDLVGSRSTGTTRSTGRDLAAQRQEIGQQVHVAAPQPGSLTAAQPESSVTVTPKWGQ